MKKTGMVLGKFLPLHKGHIYLIEFAERFVDELTVVVGSLKAEPIPGEIRYNWVKELFPKVNVVHLTDENPQYPHEHPDFWDIWKESLLKVLPVQVDYVFASESYGSPLAEILNADFIPCDQARSLVPVSGTAIREGVFENWGFLPRNVRSYFMKKVCIFGPESTGKSTLSVQLAEYYKTNYVPEYARTFSEAKERDFKYEDMELIARGQIASMESLIKDSDKVIFSDTDILTTRIWSQWLFNKCTNYVQSVSQDFDLYLLMDVDVPWCEDDIRYFPEKRQEFFNECRETLEYFSLPYVVISGDWEQRFEKAIEAVDVLLKKEGTL